MLFQVAGTGAPSVTFKNMKLNLFFSLALFLTLSLQLATGSQAVANRDSNNSKGTQLTSSFLLLFDTESSRQASAKQYWGGETMGSLAVQPKLVFDLKAKADTPVPADD